MFIGIVAIRKFCNLLQKTYQRKIVNLFGLLQLMRPLPLRLSTILTQFYTKNVSLFISRKFLFDAGSF